MIYFHFIFLVLLPSGSRLGPTSRTQLKSVVNIWLFSPIGSGKQSYQCDGSQFNLFHVLCCSALRSPSSSAPLSADRQGSTSPHAIPDTDHRYRGWHGCLPRTVWSLQLHLCQTCLHILRRGKTAFVDFVFSQELKKLLKNTWKMDDR